MERRHLVDQFSSVRALRSDSGKPAMITGYAAVFYRENEPATEYKLWDGLYERINPGAFDRAISEKHDARGLFNHDMNHILGRVGASTLRISIDATGLRYEIDLPDTQTARDVATSIDRGDITGSSFAFNPRRVSWTEEGDRITRLIEDVDLHDVGPVTFPAYEATSTGVRSSERGQIEKDLHDWRAAVQVERDRQRMSRDVFSRVVQIGVDKLE